jgi:hypothetical protein
VGSHSNIHLAYIAGFLDGDGSLMLQIKKRKDGRSKWRFMSTICLYQDMRHERTLYWIQKVFRKGYISRRNDGITELRVNGFREVKNLLKVLLPFIRFKKKQAQALYKATEMLSKKKKPYLSQKDLWRLVEYILVIQQENYTTRKKKTREELRKILELTP